MTTTPRTTSRREFLAAAGAASACLSTGVRASAAPALRRGKGKNVLVLGGTAYLGPAIVESLLADGHDVTLFNRGRTNAEMFPDVRKLRGQRRRPDFGSRGAPQDLKALETGAWDAVIDTSGYWPGNVEDVVAKLRERCGHYVFISSISVYADLEKNSATVAEDSRLGTLDDKYTPKLDNDTYGPLKAYCEQAVVDGFGADRSTLIRPGYIVGPKDPFDRLTSRVARIAQGGTTLAPGNPRAEVQWIDVADLGRFVAKCAVEGISGPFNATGFEARITAEEFHHAAKLTLNHDTEFVWVDDDFLENRGMTPWGHFACWTPDHLRNLTRVERAIDAGLTFRPIVETIQRTYAWFRDERGEKPMRGGLPLEKERELLKEWREKR